MPATRSFVAKLAIAFVCLMVTLSNVTTPAYADELKNKGLFISPLRTYVTLGAGDQKTRSFGIANLTEEPITVTLSAESFSMTDYAYDYSFATSQNDWLKLGKTSVELSPNQSQEIAYTFTIPKNAPPGGQYYTIFASANMTVNGIAGTIRATTLVYVTVDGTLTYTSELKNQSIPQIVWTPQLSYSLDVLNTGNTHYFAQFESKLDGLFYSKTPSSNSYLLMPGVIRRVQDTFSSPPLPGVYTLTYSYTTDAKNAVTIKYSRLIVFIPPWFIVTIFVVGFGLYKWRNTRRRKNKINPTRSTDS